MFVEDHFFKTYLVFKQFAVLQKEYFAFNISLIMEFFQNKLWTSRNHMLLAWLHNL